MCHLAFVFAFFCREGATRRTKTSDKRRDCGMRRRRPLRSCASRRVSSPAYVAHDSFFFSCVRLFFGSRTSKDPAPSKKGGRGGCYSGSCGVIIWCRLFVARVFRVFEHQPQTTFALLVLASSTVVFRVMDWTIVVVEERCPVRRSFVIVAIFPVCSLLLVLIVVGDRSQLGVCVCVLLPTRTQPSPALQSHLGTE